MRIVWTYDARDDLATIREYVSRNSPHYASLVVARLIESVKQLQKFPLSGRIVPEVNSTEYRELVRGKYRVVYRIRGNVIEVLMIFHTSRDPDDISNKFIDA